MSKTGSSTSDSAGSRSSRSLEDPVLVMIRAAGDAEYGLIAALSLSARSGITDHPLDKEQVVREAWEAHEPKLRSAYFALRDAASDESCRDIRDLAAEVMDCLRQLWAETDYPVFATGSYKRASRFGEVRHILHQTLERLAFFEGYLSDAAGSDALLTDLEDRIWRYLESRAGTGKEIAREAMSTEASVRKAIANMRGKGHNVATKRGRGYFRPDAPPG